MWFKNLTLYRLPTCWAITQYEIVDSLATQAFKPAGNMELQSQGWVPPREHGSLVHAVNGQFLLKLCTEKKLLPSSVVNEAAKLRAEEIEEQQGFNPGRKQLRELKEQVTDELLPRAFTVKSHTSVWIDPVNGWLVVDAASSSRADDVLRLLLKAIERFPVQSLRVKCSPVSAMTSWLCTDQAPAGFTIDNDTELRSAGEGRATVRYTRQAMDVADVQRHIASNKHCTRLAMTWQDRISFVLTESLTIKRIAPLDILQERTAEGQNDDERFDGDFVLMTGELGKLLVELVDALGGEHDEQVDLVTQQAQVDVLVAA